MILSLILAIVTGISTFPDCPDGFVFSQPVSHCYHISQTPMTWDKASDYCSKKGGLLVTLWTWTEFLYVANFTSTSMFQPWLSYHRRDVDGKFYDSDGELAYSFWAEDEPSANGDCVTYRATTGLQATPCYMLQPAVCKKELFLCLNQTHYGSLEQRSGEIMSPGWPGQYYNNLNCSYVITAPVDTYITLTFDPYDVESYDWICVYDGPNTTYTYLGTPGKIWANIYKSSSNVISFNFITNQQDVDNGWIAKWIVKPNTPPIYQYGTNGSLTSDNYPQNYAPYTEQIYHINAGLDFWVNLTITDFETEKDVDVLLIYNSSNDLDSHLIANLSGTLPTPWNILSTTNFLTLKFLSDSKIEYRGWKLNWFRQ